MPWKTSKSVNSIEEGDPGAQKSVTFSLKWEGKLPDDFQGKFLSAYAHVEIRDGTTDGYDNVHFETGFAKFGVMSLYKTIGSPLEGKITVLFDSDEFKETDEYFDVYFDHASVNTKDSSGNPVNEKHLIDQTQRVVIEDDDVPTPLFVFPEETLPVPGDLGPGGADDTDNDGQSDLDAAAPAGWKPGELGLDTGLGFDPVKHFEDLHKIGKTDGKSAESKASYQLDGPANSLTIDGAGMVRSEAETSETGLGNADSFVFNAEATAAHMFPVDEFGPAGMRDGPSPGDQPGPDPFLPGAPVDELTDLEPFALLDALVW